MRRSLIFAALGLAAASHASPSFSFRLDASVDRGSFHNESHLTAANLTAQGNLDYSSRGPGPSFSTNIGVQANNSDGFAGVNLFLSNDDGIGADSYAWSFDYRRTDRNLFTVDSTVTGPVVVRFDQPTLSPITSQFGGYVRVNGDESPTINRTVALAGNQAFDFAVGVRGAGSFSGGNGNGRLESQTYVNVKYQDYIALYVNPKLIGHVSVSGDTPFDIRADSTLPVPEPASFLVLGLGFLAVRRAKAGR